MYYLNENLTDLVRVFDQNERSGYLRLDLNENPGGLPAPFVESVLKEITPEFVAKYPETRHFTDVLASFLGTDNAHICLTNGSAEGIRYVIEAFTAPGGIITGVVPSYFMFQIYAQMYGRQFNKVPYAADLTMPVDRILDALTEETQLLILLNPNNPMGNVYSDEEFERILQVCREKEITLLIDEAYHYFWPKTFLQYALRERRVFVTRTFSKLFSMGGCRLGYVVGHPDDLCMVQKLCTPHNTNAFAMLFAERILCSPDLLDELIRKYHAGRRFLIESLDTLGYRHVGQAGNFLFIQPKTDAKTVVARMKTEKRILIKSYSDVGVLGDCLRVSIGEQQIMQRFLAALTEIDR